MKVQKFLPLLFPETAILRPLPGKHKNNRHKCTEMLKNRIMAIHLVNLLYKIIYAEFLQFIKNLFS